MLDGTKLALRVPGGPDGPRIRSAVLAAIISLNEAPAYPDDETYLVGFNITRDGEPDIKDFAGTIEFFERKAG